MKGYGEEQGYQGIGTRIGFFGNMQPARIIVEAKWYKKNPQKKPPKRPLVVTTRSAMTCKLETR